MKQQQKWSIFGVCDLGKRRVGSFFYSIYHSRFSFSFASLLLLWASPRTRQKKKERLNETQEKLVYKSQSQLNKTFHFTAKKKELEFSRPPTIDG